ncbi:hypothetical protein Tco_1555215 [Tanacetum coccineum]
MLGVITLRDARSHYPKRYWELLPEEILGVFTRRDAGSHYPKRCWESLPEEMLSCGCLYPNGVTASMYLGKNISGDTEGLWNELARLELGRRMWRMFVVPRLTRGRNEVIFDVLSNILPIWDVTVNWISPMSKGKSVTSIVGRLLIAAS